MRLRGMLGLAALLAAFGAGVGLGIFVPDDEDARRSDRTVVEGAPDAVSRPERSAPRDLLDAIPDAPAPAGIKEDDGAQRVRILAKEQPALRLTVSTPLGLRGSRIVGWLLRVGGERVPSAEQLVQDGRFVFMSFGAQALVWKNLEPGRYLVGVNFGSQAGVAATAEVVIAAGIKELALELLEPSGAGVLKVRVLGPDGKDVRDVDWLIRHRLDGSFSSNVADSLDRDSGIRFLSVFDADEYEGGTHTIEAKSARWGTIVAAFDPDSSDTLEMRFAQPAEVTGRVAGYVGSGYEGRVRYQWEDPANRPMVSWYEQALSIDENGGLGAMSVQPSERILVLYVKSGESDFNLIAERRIHLRSGPQEVSIAMPALHTLRFIWSGKGRPRVGVQGAVPTESLREDLPSYQRKVGKDGAVTFDALLPGRYKVTVFGHGRGQSRVVEIPAQSEIRLP